MMTQNIEQRTSDWFTARLGKVTASKIADVMARTKTGYSASRANYAAQLITERLTGRREEGFTNSAMQWGTDTEPQARAMYELETGATVVECGFFDHHTIHMTGASPDGLVGERGLVEIKCPNSATHIATLRGEPIPDKYIKQMQWQIACTQRDWCDFASFDPRLPDAMQLHIQRIERDDTLIAEMEAAVFEFLREVDATVTDLTARYLKEAA
jgi:putative phage-type endonuclease